jgi:hypothetical protein
MIGWSKMNERLHEMSPNWMLLYMQMLVYRQRTKIVIRLYGYFIIRKKMKCLKQKQLLFIIVGRSMFLRRFVCLMVFNATFNNNSVISCQVNFIFGGNRSTRRKPHFLFKHKLKLFVFKYIIIVLYFWRSKFSFGLKSWTQKL